MEDTALEMDTKWAGKARWQPEIREKRPKRNNLRPFLTVSRLKLPLGIADAMHGCMTSLTKTATPEVTFGLHNAFAAMAAKVRALLEAQAPIGYQDETGFHTGIKPRDPEAAGMAAW
jgi:hypothetical protein